MAKKTIEDIQVKGKKVLVRCDFNVPLDENKVITDENRIRGALPTIKYLMGQGARVILCSHLGRPKGGFDMKYSLKPVADRLSQLLGRDVPLAKDVIGPDAHRLGRRADRRRRDADRKRPLPSRREKNDPEFAKQLASLAEVY
jgi:phosphoglycerate kinase